MSRSWRWIAVGAIGLGLTMLVVVAGLAWRSNMQTGQSASKSAVGTAAPLRVLGVYAHYPYSNPKVWDVGVDLAGCCWADRVAHATMHQASTGVDAAGLVGYGYTDPDIRPLSDGSLNPGITIKFRGYFQAGPAAIDVCDSRRCATTDVIVPEASPG